MELEEKYREILKNVMDKNYAEFEKNLGDIIKDKLQSELENKVAEIEARLFTNQEE